MSRPSRIELVAKFFPELMEGKSTGGDREAAIQYSLLACEVVMSDLLQKFDREHDKYGPGVLCMRLNKGARKSESALKDLQDDYDMAESDGLTELSKQLKGAVDVIKESNINQCGLLMRVDNSGIGIMRIPRENPASAVKAMMEEISG